MSSPPRNPETILVRAPNWIGDQVLAFPFFHFLRAQFPRARISVLCAGWVSAIQFRGYVDEVIELPRARPNLDGSRPTAFHHFQAMEAAGRQLRAKSWDLGFLLTSSFSSAWIFRRGGVRHIVGYAGDSRKLLLHQALPARAQEGVHRADAYLQLLSTMRERGSDALPEASEFWREPPPADPEAVDDPAPYTLETFDAARHWPEARAVPPLAKPYWVLAPGSQAESRRWSIEHYLELGKLIHARTGMPAVLVGGVGEISLLKAFETGAEFEWIDRVGQGSVADLWQLFRNAKFTVANDSGLAHVAALSGSRTHVVWGAGNLTRTRPLGPGEARWTLNPVDCWPCERNACPLAAGEHLKCLAGIRPERVFDEMKWLWPA